MNDIADELKPNGGSSLRDSMDRVERGMAAVAENQIRFEERLSELERVMRDHLAA